MLRRLIPLTVITLAVLGLIGQIWSIKPLYSLTGRGGMNPMTALCLIALSVQTFFSYDIAQFFSIPVLTIGALRILGYMNKGGWDRLDTMILETSSHMGSHTCVALVSISLGVLLKRKRIIIGSFSLFVGIMSMLGNIYNSNLKIFGHISANTSSAVILLAILLLISHRDNKGNLVFNSYRKKI